MVQSEVVCDHGFLDQLAQPEIEHFARRGAEYIAEAPEYWLMVGEFLLPTLKSPESHEHSLIYAASVLNFCFNSGEPRQFTAVELKQIFEALLAARKTSHALIRNTAFDALYAMRDQVRERGSDTLKERYRVLVRDSL